MNKSFKLGMVCFLGASIVIGYFVYRNGYATRTKTSSINPVESPTNTFGYVKGKLAIVSFSDGQGSGFVVKQGDKKYFVTNEHVIRSGNGAEPQVVMLNGNSLKVGKCEIARDRDLIRFEIDDDIEALSPTSETPEIGDAITIFGNSDGGGVSTQIAGTIQGVGGDRLEVSAQFVTGNSGSPVIDSRGSVVGVATYLTNYTNSNDWVKSGTRFNGVRRYATRLADAAWLPIDWMEYSRQSKAFNDIEYFMTCLKPYLFACYYDVPDSMLSYSESDRLNYNSLSNGLHNALIKVRNSHRELMQACVEWSRVAKAKGRLTDYLKGQDDKEQATIIKEYDSVSRDKLATAVEKLFAFNQSLCTALRAGQRMIETSAITIPVLKKGLSEASGVAGYSKSMEAFLIDTEERLSACSNVVEYAAKLIDGKTRDAELGFVVLDHVARAGDREAIMKICDLLSESMEQESMDWMNDGHIQKWIKLGFDSGRKKLGWFLGNAAYDAMQYKDAEMYWKAAANAGVVGAWVRIGEFYFKEQEHGGGPRNMRDPGKAREAFKIAYESGSATTSQRDGALYYGTILITYPRSKDDMVKGEEIFSALINANPKDAFNYWMRGIATYVLEHGRCTGEWKTYIENAAKNGYELAKQALDDESMLYQFYVDSMKEIKLRIGGVGMRLDRFRKSTWLLAKPETDDGIKKALDKAKGKVSVAIERFVFELPTGHDQLRCYQWTKGDAEWAGFKIGQIVVGGEKVDVKELSFETIASLLRGDVDSEILIWGQDLYCVPGGIRGYIDKLGQWRWFKLKRIPISYDTPMDGI